MTISELHNKGLLKRGMKFRFSESSSFYVVTDWDEDLFYVDFNYGGSSQKHQMSIRDSTYKAQLVVEVEGLEL